MFIAIIGALAQVHGAEIPKTGDRAPDFTLQSLDGETVRLGELTDRGTVVLVVLRGFPGYQCPVCDRQVNDFITAQPDLAYERARVIFVYPGPADDLKAKAAEFKSWKGREWPADFLYLLDPDYRMINAYGLRWDAPRETAYPSTFILGRNNEVRFARVSKTHRGRSTAKEILAELN
jgi:peroxiredoxin